MKERRIRKGLVFGLVLVLLTAMVIITVPMNVSAATTTWYVDGVNGNDGWDGKFPTWGGGADTNGDFLQDGPFKTIGKAISVAGAGDTINVGPATYTERFTITQTGLSLIGSGAATTIIDGSSGGIVVTIIADDVTVEEFTIRNSGNTVTPPDAGIKLAGTAINKITGCTILNNRITDNYLGISFNYADNNNNPGIKNNDIYENEEDGIGLSNSDYNEIKGNKVHDNGWDGITLGNSNNNTVTYFIDEGSNVIYNDIYNNGYDGIGLGDSNDNIIEGSKVHENEMAGISISASDNNKIQKNGDIYNYIYDNERDGILLSGEAFFNMVEENEIYNNNISGIGICGGKNNTIQGNKIYNTDGNQQYGIHIKTVFPIGISKNNIIQNNNEIYNNKQVGIYLEYSDCNLIEKNKIYNTMYGTQQYGIHLNSSGGNTIQFHKPEGENNWSIYNNKMDGILLEKCDEVNYIKGNKIYDNEWNGIHLNNSDNTNITDNNDIYNNKRDGILLENSDYNTIDGNEIHNDDYTQQYGIHLKKDWLGRISENNTIKNNCIYDNQEDGIYLNNSDNNTIEKNEINNTDTGSQQYGIHLYNSKNNTIQYHKPEGGNNWGIYDNKREGIFLDNCVDSGDVVNCIKENWIYDNDENGILIKDSIKSTIDGNKLYNYSTGTQKTGILLECSKEVTLQNNNMTDCGIMIEGDSIDHWNTHTIPHSGSNINKVNNKPVRYHKDVTTKTIVQSPAGEVILANCTNITVTGVDPSNGSVGILLGFTSISIIENNICNSNNYYGICLYSSDNNAISNNTCSDNEHGIVCYDSDFNIIFNNTCNLSKYNGIYLGSPHKITATPPNSGTGRVTWYGVKLSGDIYVYWIDFYDYLRGWAKIDLTNIPDNAIITKVVFRANVAYDNGVDLAGVRLLTSDPTTASGSTVFNEAGSGTRLFGINWTIGCKKVDMGSTGITLVQNALEEDWIGFGFDLEEPITQGWYSGYIYGYNYSLPVLEIEYIIPSPCNNILINNNCSNNNNGIYLLGDNNTLIYNNLESNTNYGVAIFHSNNNSIYHNNFINNNGGNVQANDTGGNNYWDNGYPDGGNYWDDFETTIGSAYDDYQGVNQNYVNFYGFGDGIIDKGSGAGGGKKPYNISGGNNKDNYPLIKPVINYRVQRPPIRIDSNTDFNANNGITDGSGTEADPYIIENWHINGSGYGNCIYIGNTTVYFVIRNCYVYEASGAVDQCPWYQNAGITFYFVQNGTITSFDWNIGDPYGVGITITKPTIAENNYCLGILLTGDWEDEIQYYSHNNIINNCIIKDNGDAVDYDAGIYLQYSHDNQINNNLILNNGISGIYLQFKAFNNKIFSNEIVNNINYGIEINYEQYPILAMFSIDNSIYYNNFIENNYNHQSQTYNGPQALDYGDNIWDIGYPFGGNYWDDFDEPGEDAYDEYRGPLHSLLHKSSLSIFNQM